MNLARYHMELRAIGCVVCIMALGIRGTPAELHHLFEAHQRDDRLVCPLCRAHHQGAPGVVGFHPGGERRFRAAYGFGEMEMLAKTVEEFFRRVG